MAILQGISAMQMGDGDGGKMALSLKEGVLRILADSHFAYTTATMTNPEMVRNGVVAYQVPLVITASRNYNPDGKNNWNKYESKLRQVILNIAREQKTEIETFDLARSQTVDAIKGNIETALAISIKKDLSCIYFEKLMEHVTAESTRQMIMPDLFDDSGTYNKEKARKCINLIRLAIVKMGKLHNKEMLGVEKQEFLVMLDGIADNYLKNAFEGEWRGMTYYMSNSLQGWEMGGFKYMIDEMINNNIPAGTSFREEGFDSTKFAGFIVHNEAVAMPINLEEIIIMRNPDNGNLRYLAKYGLGIDILRPDLIKGFVKQALTPSRANR